MREIGLCLVAVLLDAHLIEAVESRQSVRATSAFPLTNFTVSMID
jgi:hypothetical protein